MGAKCLHAADDTPGAACQLNKACHRRFTKLRDNEEFIRVAAKHPGGAEAVGSHSNQKLQKTLAKRCGINSQDSAIVGDRTTPMCRIVARVSLIVSNVMLVERLFAVATVVVDCGRIFVFRCRIFVFHCRIFVFRLGSHLFDLRSLTFRLSL